MRNEGAIKHKAKQVRFRYLKQALEENLSPCASNCKHNRRLLLPDGEEVGVCGFSWPSEKGWPGICDEQYHDYAEDHPAFEGGCPQYLPKHSKEEIKNDFNTWLQEASLPEVAAKCPDLAALLWVLESDSPDEVPAQDPFDTSFALSLGGLGAVHLTSASERDMLAKFLSELAVACSSRQESEDSLRTSFQDLKALYDDLKKSYDAELVEKETLQARNSTLQFKLDDCRQELEEESELAQKAAQRDATRQHPTSLWGRLWNTVLAWWGDV